MDIFPEMLQEVEKRVKENSILNVVTILTEENDMKLEDVKITIAFISNVLHEAENEEKFLSEINSTEIMKV